MKKHGDDDPDYWKRHLDRYDHPHQYQIINHRRWKDAAHIAVGILLIAGVIFAAMCSCWFYV